MSSKAVVLDGLRYAVSHEWVRLEEGGEGVVGISDVAQRELTDLVFVELPEVGRVLRRGVGCAVVESVKAGSDIYSPVSGRVVGVNEGVVGDAGLVNVDPYGGGWLFRVVLSDVGELDGLLSAEGYRRQVGV